MSKVVKGVKKGFKKVGKFLKKNWKPIVAIGLGALTGGIATIGLSGFKSALAGGFWKGLGSTMWAGVTATAGTFGIGSGASGAAAAAAGATGNTLLTGAAAQGLGLASKAASAGAAGSATANLGVYAGPGKSFLGGGGSLFGGAAGAPAAQMSAVAPTQGSIASQLTAGVPTNPGLMSTVAPSGAPVTNALTQGASSGMGLKGAMAVAATPALINAAGGYFAARSQEEMDDKPIDAFGVSGKDPTQIYRQNYMSPHAGYINPDGTYAGYDPRMYQSGPNGLMSLDPNRYV